MKRSRAQNIVEYSIVLSLVISGFLAMQAYLRRGIQQGIRLSADQFGAQEDGLPVVIRGSGIQVDSPVGSTIKPGARNWDTAVITQGAAVKSSNQESTDELYSCNSMGSGGKYFIPGDPQLHEYKPNMEWWENCWEREEDPNHPGRYKLVRKSGQGGAGK